MKQKRKLLKGSVNEKLDQVDKLLWHLKVRRGNYVIGVTPPIPVFDYTDSPDANGVVFRKIMPADGAITVGCMWVDEVDTKLNPIATLLIEDRQGGNNVNIPVNCQALSIQPNLPVSFGQRITLSISPIEACKGIWTAFLFEVDQKHVAAHNQLMNGFLELAEIASEELDNA